MSPRWFARWRDAMAWARMEATRTGRRQTVRHFRVLENGWLVREVGA